MQQIYTFVFCIVVGDDAQICRNKCRHRHQPWSRKPDEFGKRFSSYSQRTWTWNCTLLDMDWSMKLRIWGIKINNNTKCLFLHRILIVLLFKNKRWSLRFTEIPWMLSSTIPGTANTFPKPFGSTDSIFPYKPTCLLNSCKTCPTSLQTANSQTKEFLGNQWHSQRTGDPRPL